jgi:hypothetical protein
MERTENIDKNDFAESALTAAKSQNDIYSEERTDWENNCE